VDSAIAGLIGASIGAIAGLLGSFLSNWLLIRREREQFIREQEAERDRWLRDSLQEIYSNSINYLTIIVNKYAKLPEDVPSSIEEIKEWAYDFSEAQKWLGLLLTYHPERNSTEFNSLTQSIVKFSKNDNTDLWLAKELRDQIIDLAAEDIRLIKKRSTN